MTFQAGSLIGPKECFEATKRGPRKVRRGRSSHLFAARIQHFADLACQTSRGEGLLKEGAARFQYAVADNGIMKRITHISVQCPAIAR